MIILIFHGRVEGNELTKEEKLMKCTNTVTILSVICFNMLSPTTSHSIVLEGGFIGGYDTFTTEAELDRHWLKFVTYFSATSWSDLTNEVRDAGFHRASWSEVGALFSANDFSTPTAHDTMIAWEGPTDWYEFAILDDDIIEWSTPWNTWEGSAYFGYLSEMEESPSTYMPITADFISTVFAYTDVPDPVGVPEPTVLLLIGTGLTGIAGVRCRKTKTK